MEPIIVAILNLVNETLASAIVIIAASLLLYNLTRNLSNRVARTSALVLGCVVVSYVCDVFTSLQPSPGTYAAVLRLQWIGIAFMPVAMLHLSDALLATTGLPSRGRRRRIIRLLYLLSAVFLLLAAFTNQIIQPTSITPAYFEGVYVTAQPGPLFLVYALYFVLGTLFAFINVGRARRRCLTRDTRRRMGYLQIALLTPALGIFPFSMLLQGEEFSLIGLFIVNLANIVVILMLAFLAYPLSFFGSRIPDRVVKTELLRFLVRGPATGILALVAVLYTLPATRILGIPGQSFTPFAVVAVVLLWQWFIAGALPHLERLLVYAGEAREEYDRMSRLQTLSDRILTRDDLVQLLEATLAAAVNYLRVSSAFVATLGENEAEVIATVGAARPTADLLNQESTALQQALIIQPQEKPTLWQSFWVLPLYRQRTDTRTVLGIMAVQARAAQVDLGEDDISELTALTRRAESTLNDLVLQADIVAALEGLLPQIRITSGTRDSIEYAPPRTPQLAPPVADVEQFKEQVRAALRHYWGGPGLTSSHLLDLNIVQQSLGENDNNPGRALRAVLLKAIDAQKPEGERKLLSPEWTLYNILEMRFVRGAKVKEVGSRLAMSEADLYRKQRVAIDAVADSLLEMEQASQNGTSFSTNGHTPASSP